MSFTVRVVNDEDEPVEGAVARISFTIPLRGISPEERTDDDGLSEFGDYDNGEITVYVDGRSVGSFYYEDVEEITVSN